MSIKILGGKVKGLPLFIPPESITRPTSVQLRRRPFDFRQDWDGWEFVDLCAGSGSMGLEAWSRGARRVHLVESHSKAQDSITKNIKLIGERCPDELASRPVLAVRSQALAWLRRFKLQHQEQTPDLRASTCLFFDPPYEDHQLYKEVWKELVADGWYEGELWLESDDAKGVPASHWPQTEGAWSLFKEYRQGSTFIRAYHLR